MTVTIPTRLVRHRVVLAGVGLLLFGFSWLLRFNDLDSSFAGLTDDHYFYLVRGWQILFGDLPVRDFVDHGAPLYYYVAAAVQELFGRGTLSEAMFSVTALAVAASATFWLASRASGSIAAGLLGASFQTLLLPRFYNYPKLLVYCAAIPMLWWFASRPGRWPRFWLAVVTAVAFLFRHDHGVFIALGFAGLLLLLTDVAWRQRVRHAVIYAGLVLLLLAPYLLFIQLNGGVLTYITQAAAWAERDRGRTSITWPGVVDYPDGRSLAEGQGSLLERSLASIKDNRVAWIYYSEITLPLLAILVLLVSHKGTRMSWARAGPKIAVVALLGLLLNAGFLRSPLEARLADPSVPHAILIAWLAVATWSLLANQDGWRPVLRSPRLSWYRAALASTVVPFAMIVGAAVSANVVDRFDRAQLLEGPGEAFRRASINRNRLQTDWQLASWTDRESRSDLMTLSRYLNACTAPSDRVFVGAYLPQVAALARRAFAGGHAGLRPGFFETPAAQQLTVSRLRRWYSPIALIETEDSLDGYRAAFPILMAYFDEQYDSVGEYVLDDRFRLALLLRKDAMRTGTFEPFGWPCLR